MSNFPPLQAVQQDRRSVASVSYCNEPTQCNTLQSDKLNTCALSISVNDKLLSESLNPSLNNPSHVNLFEIQQVSTSVNNSFLGVRSIQTSMLRCNNSQE